jgi:hypothetical protein
MNRRYAHWLPLLVVLPLVVACGGGSSSGGSPATASPSTSPGTLVYNPPLRSLSLTAATFQATLDSSTSGQQLHALARGSATLPILCGVDIYKLQFRTLGGNSAAPEATQSSGALMVPTGAGCTGPRPIVLYAHGTTTDKSFDITQVGDPSNPANGEAALIAAVYASNGFIVVAPNYAGYDISTLGYHPYLNAKQQSLEMQHSLAAARTALAGVSGTADAGLLYISGYSQGGHVAMATLRDLEAAGQTVTAAATMSGPYAMEAFGDIIMGGTVDVGATIFLPLLSTSYQKAYGNLYATPSDLYSATYASGIETLLPSALSTTQIFTQGLLPQSAAFNVAPLAPYQAIAPTSPTTFGFGNPYLVNDAARASYLADAAPTGNPDGALYSTASPGMPAATPMNPIRIALRKNDLRLPATGSALPVWIPRAPVLMCVGGYDPVVFSTNTLIMKSYFDAAQAALSPGATLIRHVLNVDLNPTSPQGASCDATTQICPLSESADPAFGPLQQQFTGYYNLQAGTSAATVQAALINYHETVAPFCTAASASFFASPR